MSKLDDSSANSAKDNLFRNRATLLLILGLFVAPALIAYFTLKTGSWKTNELTHHGELITPPLQTEILSLRPLSPKQDTASEESASKESASETLAKSSWQLFYLVPENCDEACLNSQYIMQQVHTGLGPYRHRAKTNQIFLSQSTFLSPTAETSASEALNADADIEKPEENSSSVANNWLLLNKPTALVEPDRTPDAEPTLKAGYLYIADPLGNIMLKYKISQETQEAIRQAKGVLSDMKKLLKLSRIG